MFAKVDFKCCIYFEEEFEDTKVVIGIRRPKDRQHNGQIKRPNGQTTIYKTFTYY